MTRARFKLTTDWDGDDAIPIGHTFGCRRDEMAFVHLDAMIPREDFGYEGEGKDYQLDLFPSLRIADLVLDSPIRQLLRKPDFQR